MITEKNSVQVPTPPPLEKPPFTIKELTDIIPVHCFKRSLIKSLGHLFLNLTICGVLLYLATMINYTAVTVQYLLWPLYWYLQGVYMGGLWVLAHECGHGAFSDYTNLNNTIGFILHSFLLVPYQSWKITHRAHHLNSANCDHDQVFVPPTRSSVQSVIVEMLEESPLYNFCTLVLMLIFGWMPAYLITNFGGPLTYEMKANHFDPSSTLYSPNHRNQVIRANFGIATTVVILGTIWTIYGETTVIFYYIIPYMIVNCHLVVVTFLNHTDSYIPRYREPEWTWMRGALSTVDRSFGLWLDHALHHISNTHVCHHLFPKMPFYHTVEATQSMRTILGLYYLRDDTPILKALWRAYRNCKFIEDDDPIVFYRRNLKSMVSKENDSDCTVTLCDLKPVATDD